MKRLSIILTTVMLCAGCETLPPKTALGQADTTLAAHDYSGAIAAYSEFLSANPQDPQAPRARATQAALDRLLTSQTELERLQQGEVPRLQRELADRQSEADRLKGEVAKLRSDLERLRNIDLNELKQAPKK